MSEETVSLRTKKAPGSSLCLEEKLSCDHAEGVRVSPCTAVDTHSRAENRSHTSQKYKALHIPAKADVFDEALGTQLLTEICLLHSCRQRHQKPSIIDM